MDPEAKYPFLRELLQNFSLRHRKSLGVVLAALIVTGQARSLAVATTLARWLGTRLDSAVNRFYRLLRNTRIDELALVEQWARMLVTRTNRHLIIAVDWTEWAHELRLLVAAVVCGKRAVPLWAQCFHRSVMARSQNARENNFLRVLVDVLRRVGATPTFVADRGFRRTSFLTLLLDLRVHFAVRLMTDVHVEIAPGIRVALHDFWLQPGQRLDLGFVPLRSDGAVMVRVVGYWAPRAKEPWWIASDHDGSILDILSVYDRRMTVEEQIRDWKGSRFGAQLRWTHFANPEHLARIFLLVGIALATWLVLGRIAAERDPSLRLVCRRRGPRQSYVTIGIRLAQRDAPSGLDALWLALLLEPPAMRPIGALHVGGK